VEPDLRRRVAGGWWLVAREIISMLLFGKRGEKILPVLYLPLLIHL
jgi:hypothetical protein